MGYVNCWTAALLVLFIAGCSSPPPPKQNVFDPLTQQLYKARARTIDNQERGESTR